MGKSSMKWAGVAVAAIIGTTAWAGYKESKPVFVSLGTGGSGTAWGSLAEARNSSNSSEYIGCFVHSYASTTGGTARIICLAYTASGIFGNCSSYDPALVTAARGIGDDSVIEFQWNTSGQCSYLLVTKFSYYQPKLF